MKQGPKIKNINKILVDRLRKYNFQNFSQLLNCPEPEPTYFSYFESLANLIYDSVYNEKSTLDNEINNDIDKFSEDCITIEDSSNTIKYLKKNETPETPSNDNINKSNKPNLKILLEEPIETYINKIISKYNRYCSNHKEIEKMKKDDDINNINKRFLNLKSLYVSNKNILVNIPDEYKVSSSEFKTEPNLLCKPVNFLQNKCTTLIEMSSQIDKELEKVLEHTSKLDNYIQVNWKPWNNNINLYYDNIKDYHKKVDSIKKKSLFNTSKLILKEIKRKNIKKIKKIFIQFKNMKESINSLKVLITDVKKYKLTNELINQNKAMLDKFKKNINKKISLIDLFDISFDNFKNKNSSHMSGELTQILNDFFNGFAFLDKAFENNFQNFNITQKNYITLTTSSYGVKFLLTHLQFKEQKDEIEKIYSVCDYFIQNNLVNSIYIKLRGIFTNLANDSLNKMLDFFKNEINRKEEKDDEIATSASSNENDAVNEADIELRGEQCLLLCLIVTKIKFFKNIKDFINEILKIINESQNESITKIIKNNFITECNEISTKIENNLNSLVKNQLAKCFNKSTMNMTNDNFLKNYYLIYDLMLPIIKDDELMKNSLLEYLQNYILNWKQHKLDKFNTQDYQSWDPLSEVPPEYQLELDFYFEFDISQNCIGDNFNEYEEKCANFEKMKNDFCKVGGDGEVKKNKFISVKFKNNKKETETMEIKINSTALDIIKTSINVLKLFCLISPGGYGILLESFSEILLKHLTYQKDEIFNYKNSSTVSQKEVCMTYTIFLLVKFIYQHFKDCEFFVQIMKHSQQKSIDLFLSIFKAINESLDLSKKKIEEVFNSSCIDESLKALEKIQLPNYNVKEKGVDEVPVNEYVYSFICIMQIIYESMLNCYENDFMAKIFQNGIAKFFDKFEYFMFHGTKIEEEKCLKQFRSDMTFLKRNLTFINIFDLTEIKARIDNINKKVLPEHMLKAKKKNENK
jgi:hypothetical protein